MQELKFTISQSGGRGGGGVQVGGGGGGRARIGCLSSARDNIAIIDMRFGSWGDDAQSSRTMQLSTILIVCIPIDLALEVPRQKTKSMPIFYMVFKP